MADAAPPGPAPDPVTAPFWEGCARGELRVQQCRDCRARWLPGSVVCPRCWSPATAWVAVSGAATVVSAAVYRRSYHPAFASRVPYAVAVVELAEGPRLVSAVVGVAPDRVHPGLAVRVEFQPAGEAVLPVFRPVAEGAGR